MQLRIYRTIDPRHSVLRLRHRDDRYDQAGRPRSTTQRARHPTSRSLLERGTIHRPAIHQSPVIAQQLRQVAQLCGDAHLSNFGAFASPERQLLFDLNDFDETLPGPFEYDVKRMAASFTIAARNNGLTAAETREVTVSSVRSYRKAMAEFAQMRTLDLWYTHMSEDDLRVALTKIEAPAAAGKGTATGKGRKGKAAKALSKEEAAAKRRSEKNIQKAHTRDSLQALSKLGEVVGGHYRIVSQPPIVVPSRDLAATYNLSADDIEQVIRHQFHEYRSTLPEDRRHLLERYEIVDVARKVVGVGSVGTRAYICLLYT